METPYEQSQGFLQTLNESARLLSQNRPGEALQRLLPLQQAAPANPDVAINIGGAYILQRKWERAVRALRQAVDQHPDNAMLWANLAAAELGNLETSGPAQQERAIAAYERAIQVDSHSPNVDYHLGLIYKHRGELNRASAFFQRALEVQPADRDARLWLDRMTMLASEQEAIRQAGERLAGATVGANGGVPQQADPASDAPYGGRDGVHDDAGEVTNENGRVESDSESG